MAVPKRKVSPSRRNMRRSHHALGANSYVEDKETGELKRPHHVDLKTGMYKGRQVITPKADKAFDVSAPSGAGEFRKPPSGMPGGGFCMGPSGWRFAHAGEGG